MEIQKIGIDAGGTLIKVVYNEHNRFHYKRFPVTQLKEAAAWIRMIAPGASVCVTGGKAGILQQNHFHEATIIPEFQASCEGANFLIKLSKLDVAKEFILVNIGTGTSWFKMKGNEFERILGSGVGGGTFTGLGTLLTGESDFAKLVNFSENGDKEKVDLLVKDIYAPLDPPIAGNMTASNFAKANATARHTDKMAAVTNMIAETIILLTVQAAKNNAVDDVVYIGSAIVGNRQLKKSIEQYTILFGLKPLFIENGEYSGALGAYLSN